MVETESADSLGANALHTPTERPARAAPGLSAFLPALVLLGAAVVILVGGHLHHRIRLLRWSRGVLRTALARMSGPRRYTIDLEPLAAPPAIADELTAALATNHRGPVLVLQDAGYGSRPFTGALDALVAALEARGVALERLHFDRDFVRVWAAPRGRPAELASFAATYGGAPLLVLGTGEGLATREGDALERALEAWPKRVLVSPLRDVALWPSDLAARRAPIAAVPLTHAGMREARSILGGAALSQEPPPSAGASFDWRNVSRLRAMLSFAPAPSFELAEALRRRFLPDAPEEIVLAVDGIVRDHAGGRREREVVEAVAAFRAEDPRGDDEAAVRRFLLEQIERGGPPEERSAAHLRWRCDVAIARLHLAATAAERQAARETVLALAGTAIAPELLDELARHGDAERTRGVRRHGISSLRAPVARRALRAAREIARRRPPRSIFPFISAGLVLAAFATLALAATALPSLVTDELLSGAQGIGAAVPVPTTSPTATSPTQPQSYTPFPEPQRSPPVDPAAASTWSVPQTPSRDGGNGAGPAGVDGGSAVHHPLLLDGGKDSSPRGGQGRPIHRPVESDDAGPERPPVIRHPVEPTEGRGDGGPGKGGVPSGPRGVPPNEGHDGGTPGRGVGRDSPGPRPHDSGASEQHR